jgi:hypothetical protein
MDEGDRDRVALDALRPADDVQRRVVRTAMARIRAQQAASAPAASAGSTILELPARHARWLVPAAAALWLLVLLRPAASGARAGSDDAARRDGALPVPVLTTAWGLSPASAVGAAALSPEQRLFRFAERAR